MSQSTEYGRTQQDLTHAEPFCDKCNERLDKRLVYADWLARILTSDPTTWL